MVEEMPVWAWRLVYVEMSKAGHNYQACNVELINDTLSRKYGFVASVVRIDGPHGAIITDLLLEITNEARYLLSQIQWEHT
jgi:hypothetical protein